MLHLKATSYAKHVALNEFYDALVPLVDTLAETYQGAHGLIQNYPARYAPVDDPVSLVSQLGAWVEDKRYDCCEADETCLQNTIDEIIALCHSTTYKLKVLK